MIFVVAGLRRVCATARGLTEKVDYVSIRIRRWSAFYHLVLTRRRSQVVRQRSAKPLSIGSIPIAASIHLNHLQATI
jgi:hypothetical protein